MPNYAYACPKCGERFDKLMTMTEHDTKRPRCPECKAQAKHVLFAPAVHMRYSLMHPRHNRGRAGERTIQKGNVLS